ncbi:glycosyltransferase family 2 protein [Nocardioides salarius]|uniref:glycosyltransferase family 2 protein n=1 Tax=Nocardioides salarius TaxID=374513 RepID=UPI00187A13EB
MGGELASVDVVVTTFNRRETTRQCLDGLSEQLGRGIDYDLGVILVDDASTDGTAALAEAYAPWVRVVRTDGNLFWARSMSLGLRLAAEREPDFLLMLNDDVKLDSDAIISSLQQHKSLPGPCVLAGSTRGSDDRAETTYGGLLLRGRRPTALQRVGPAGPSNRSIDTFNGNFVLIPHAVYSDVGDLDGAFAHSYADIDYGLRVKRYGYNCYLMTNHVGICDRNSTRGSYLDNELSRRIRFKHLLSPKGLPVRSQARYLRRHGGLFWPIYFAATYLRHSMRIARQM